MKMTLEMTRAILGRFAVVFPLPTASAPDDLVNVWFGVIGEFYIDEVVLACKRLMTTLTRFPFPADIVAELGRNDSEA